MLLPKIPFAVVEVSLKKKISHSGPHQIEPKPLTVRAELNTSVHGQHVTQFLCCQPYGINVGDQMSFLILERQVALKHLKTRK